MKELHLISNGKMELGEFAELVSNIFPYLTGIHLREKTVGARDLYFGISELKRVGVLSRKIVVNDRVDVAIAAGVEAVQLPFHSLEVHVVRKSFPNLRIGCSVHSVAEALIAQEQGADYVLFGHIYPSTSKPGKAPQGVKALAEVVANVSIPVIAIGGIKPEHVSEILETGAAGIAVLSTILEAEDPLAMTKSYADALGGSLCKNTMSL